MSASKLKVVGMTVAVTNMEAMLKFYREMFGLHFQLDADLSKKLGTDLYRSKFGELPLLFCPNSLAGVDAQQNRQQWDIEVAHFDDFFSDQLQELGGKVKTPPYQAGDQRVGAVIDPDGNTLVLKSSL